MHGKTGLSRRYQEWVPVCWGVGVSKKVIKDEPRKVGRGASQEGPPSVLKAVGSNGKNLNFKKITPDSF